MSPVEPNEDSDNDNTSFTDIQCLSNVEKYYELIGLVLPLG